MQTKKKVLVAPLDWGLGHATRCIPIIQALVDADFQVMIGACGAGAELLRAEFPRIPFVQLPSYSIRYSKSKRAFMLTMLLQSPRILAAIRKEHRLLKMLIQREKIDVVISDNRFGMYHRSAHCIFITHQLFIRTGNRITEKIAQRLNYRFINRFDECWIPDLAGEENCAGVLSHPNKKPAAITRYIGTLSRFAPEMTAKSFDVVAVISGPEPQRSIFEKILLDELPALPGRKLIIRGMPGNNAEIPVLRGIQIINHAGASEINGLLANAKIIIASAGYSTVMDMAALRKNAILIPTPGQGEQEYLAAYLSDKKYCITCERKNFNAEKLIAAFNAATFCEMPHANPLLLVTAISSL